jgi:hypothetical protein
MAFKKKRSRVLNAKDVVSFRAQMPLISMLPWQKFEGSDNLLRLANEDGEHDGYMEMLTIEGKDLDFVYGVGSDGASRIIQDYHTLLNTYLSDFDIIITKMPASTTIQQRSWIIIRDQILTDLQNTSDAKLLDQLQRRYKAAERIINDLHTVEEAVVHQAYTAFIYGNTPSETREQRETFIRLGGTAINASRMSLKQKKNILSMLQDPTRQLNK